MKKIDLSLTGGDPLTVLSGLIVPSPLSANSKPVNDGHIALSPTIEDTLDLAPGRFVLFFNLNGNGAAVTVKVKAGDTTLRETTIDPKVDGFGGHTLPFRVPA